MKTMNFRMVALVLLQLTFAAIGYSKECGTVYLGNSPTVLSAGRGKLLEVKINKNEDVKKLKVEQKCLMFLNRAVYGPNNGEYHQINQKARHIECCCEYYNSDNERFLNRHVIEKAPNTWNDAMKERCIPVAGRQIQTFILTTQNEVKKVCGNRGGDQDCKSKNTFTLYNIQRKNDGHYKNDHTQNNKYIVVHCTNGLPVHFQCVVGNPGCDENAFRVCN